MRKLLLALAVLGPATLPAHAAPVLRTAVAVPGQAVVQTVQYDRREYLRRQEIRRREVARRARLRRRHHYARP